jgi:hypothetical protein
VKDVKSLILRAPGIESEPVDPTPALLQKLKVVNESIEQNTTFDQELELTAKTIQNLNDDVARMEANADETAHAIVVLLRRMNESDTGGVHGNLESISRKAEALVQENESLRKAFENLKKENTCELLKIAYALPGEFDEGIPLSNYSTVIVEKVKATLAELQMKSLEIDRLTTQCQETQNLIGIVVKGFSKVLASNPPQVQDMESLRRLAGRIEREIHRLRVVETSVNHTNEIVTGRLQKIGKRLSIHVPSGKLENDLDEIWVSVDKGITESNKMRDENSRLTGFLKEMCSRFQRSVSPNASADELIAAVKGRLPSLEGSLRMEVINRMLHRRGDPTTYLPELFSELEMHERLFATIRRFGTIFDDLFLEFPRTQSMGLVDFDGFLKALRAELPIIARAKYEGYICDFFSKLVALIDSIIRYLTTVIH